jgi:hypothetical protein
VVLLGAPVAHGVARAEEPPPGLLPQTVPAWRGGDDAAFQEYARSYGRALGDFTVLGWGTVPLSSKGGPQRFADLCRPGGEHALLVEHRARSYLWRDEFSPECAERSGDEASRFWALSGNVLLARSHVSGETDFHLLGVRDGRLVEFELLRWANSSHGGPTLDHRLVPVPEARDRKGRPPSGHS